MKAEELRLRRAALVTGARRGIGRGICRALAQAGFDLVVNDVVVDEDMEKTAAEIVAAGRAVEVVQGDIADLANIAGMVDQAFSAFGVIDCLVNNAGVPAARRGDLLDVTPEDFDRTVGVNLRGTFFLTQAIAKRMLMEAAGETASPRSIITISSVSAILASVDRGEYCISKAALAMMNQLFALRLAGHGIVCHEIRPGIVHTPMTTPVAQRYDDLIAGGLSPIARWGEPEDVGQIVAAIATGSFPFVTGDAIHVDGGLHIRRL